LIERISPHQNLITVRNEEEVTKGFTGVSRGEIQRAFGSRPSPRKKRTRSEPRQYTLVDLERARDRVEAAQRRVDNDRTSNPNRGRAGLERASSTCTPSSRNYAGGASLNDGEARSRDNPRIATCYDKLACVRIAAIIAKAQLLICYPPQFPIYRV
jgi:hypothetical protein